MIDDRCRDIERKKQICKHKKDREDIKMKKIDMQR
jgi:hypothetical protein